MEQIIIPARFNGPRASGNGGYSCGVIAGFIDGVACVRLHAPPPLDTPLDVYRQEAGCVEVRYGDTLVGSGRPDTLTIESPPPPSLAEAARGSENYPCREAHFYPTCFVCGTGRPAKDGLELYTGPFHDWSMVACPWRPAADLLDGAGHVKPEFVWSALDCPGSYGAFGPERTPALLGELVLAQYRPIPGDEELVVYAWPEGRDGRKYYGGAAIATRRGEPLAVSLSTWIVTTRGT